MLNRRSLALLSLAALPTLGRAQAKALPTLPLLAAAQLLIGVERIAKLRLERDVLVTRATQESAKERVRMEESARQLLEPSRGLEALSGRRLAQVAATASAAAQFAAAPPDAADQLLSESEALVARLGFVTTALSGVSAQPELAAQLDLFARAGASALRVGKFNLAARGQPAAALRVGATQALGEFSAALQAVGTQSLSAAQQRDLQLAQNQWLLFRAALGNDGLVRDPARLGEVASTTDRMAESLVAMARRAAA